LTSNDALGEIAKHRLAESHLPPRQRNELGSAHVAAKSRPHGRGEEFDANV